jgi:hypothetical protein
VEYAFTAEPFDDFDGRFPVVMVYPLSDSFSESGYDNRVVQEQVTELVCLIGCALTDLSTHVGEVRAAAVGWVAGGAWDALEAGGGSIEGLKGPYIWWRETFTARTQLRQTA